MRVYGRKPGPPLDRFVEVLWVCEGAPPAHRKERVLPMGTVELIINLHEDKTRIYDPADFTLSQGFNGCAIAGPRTEYCVIDTEEQISVAGAHFKPGGAYPFFAPPIDELHGLHVSLDTLWGNFAAELRERLLAVSTPEERFQILEHALLQRANRPLANHGAVRFALDCFERAPEIGTVRNVTDRIGLSARRFIELFRRETGFTPKAFCRVMRFQKALERVTCGAPVEWTRVALDAGYFDQAHFIHEFRAFSGINPSTYLQAPRQHKNHVPLPE